MYEASFSPKFSKDVKSCEKKHWDISALKRAMDDVLNSDARPLDSSYRDHALVGDHRGYRAIHVQSASNPPRGKWVLIYRIVGSEVGFTRTGGHDVYRDAL